MLALDVMFSVAPRHLRTRVLEALRPWEHNPKGTPPTEGRPADDACIEEMQQALTKAGISRDVVDLRSHVGKRTLRNG